MNPFTLEKLSKAAGIGSEESHAMNNLKQRMVAEAYFRYDAVEPTGKAKGDWDKSFTKYDKSLMLWFNTLDHDTHMIKAIRDPLSGNYKIQGGKCPECNEIFHGTICQCKKTDLL